MEKIVWRSAQKWDTIGTFILEQAVAFAKTLCTEAEIKNVNQRLTAIKK